MNPDFAKYLYSQPNAAIKLWLQVLAQKPKGGAYVVLYDQLTVANDISTIKFKRLFKPRAAQKLGLLEITEVSEAGMVFKLFTKTAITPPKGVMLKKSKIAAQTNIAIKSDQVLLQTAANNQLIPLTEAVEVANVELRGAPYSVAPQCSSDLISQDFTINHNLLRCLIYDYCIFYKFMQQNLAMLVGQQIADPVNPKITSLDIKSLTNLAIYFRSCGCKTENAIRLTFQKIYNCWSRLPPHYADYFAPAQILRNINGIRIQVQKISTNYKVPNQNQTKKDANTTEKINNAGSKDYSHMVED